MKITMSLVVGGVAALAFAAPAVAASSGSIATVSASGVSFTSGSWSFDPWPCNSSCVNGTTSSWRYAGTLKDTASDGDWVYTRGKIDGYDWAGGASAEEHGGYKSTKSISQRIYYSDPPQQGKMQACRHRTGAIPNSCSESPWKYR
jgi:hypothetical protein